LKINAATVIAFMATAIASVGAGLALSPSSSSSTGNPQACLIAVDVADQRDMIIADFLRVASRLPDLITRGEEAGRQQDQAALDQITSEEVGITDEFQTLNKRADSIESTYLSAHDACRKG